MAFYQGLFSTCQIFAHERVVKKYNNNPIALGFLDNEVKWYQRFGRTTGAPLHVPKLLDYSKDTLVLEYAGSPITKDTIPVNFKNQLRQVASFLSNHHCYHCDIIPGNLLVRNSNIYLIDFEWAIEMNEDPYRKWKHIDKSLLDSVCSGYRSRNWPDDKYSLTKIYGEFTGDIQSKLFFAHES